MYAIVTVANKDGTFDAVGMNNRTSVSHLKTERGVLGWARRFARGKTFRVDFYFDRYSTQPKKTLTETTVAPPVIEEVIVLSPTATKLWSKGA